MNITDGHAFVEQKVWTRTLVGLLVAASVFLVGGHIYYRALRRYEWQVRQRMHRLRQATDEFVAARQQQKRWEIMERGVTDWVVILGNLLRSPLAADAALSPAPGSELPGIPAAVAVAVAVAKDQVDESAADLSRGAAEALCTRGWLRDEFARCLAGSPSNDPSSRASSGDLPADLDLGLRASGARNELVRVSSSPKIKQAATRAAIEKIQNLAIEGRVEVPDLTVVRTGPYSSGEPEDHTAFFSATVELTAPFASEIFSEGAQVAGLQMPAWRALTVPPGVNVTSGDTTRIERSGLSLMTRVDVSSTLKADDVSLFVRRADPKWTHQVTVTDDFN